MLTCEECGVEFPSYFSDSSCIICNKVLCNSHNKYNFCPEHWNELSLKDKKKVQKIENTSHSLFQLLLGVDILAIVLFVISLLLFAKSFDGFAYYALIILIISLILFFGSIYVNFGAKLKERQMKRYMVDLKYNIKKKTNYVKKIGKKPASAKKELSQEKLK